MQQFQRVCGLTCCNAEHASQFQSVGYGGHNSQSQLAAGSAQGLTLFKLSVAHGWAIACACHEEKLGREDS